MKTATAATPASQQRGAADRQAAGRRLKELAANLDVHRGFADVIASLEAGHGGTLGGVWGSSRALVAAAVARSCPGPLVVVAPHQAEIDAIARDLALFSDSPVAKFPAWEGEPGERVVYDEIYGERLRVLKELGAGSGEQGVKAEQPPALPGVRVGVSSDGGADDGAAANNPRQSRGLSDGSAGIIVTSIQSLLQPVPGREAMGAA